MSSRNVLEYAPRVPSRNVLDMRRVGTHQWIITTTGLTWMCWTTTLFLSCCNIMKSQPTKHFEELGEFKMAPLFIIELLLVTGCRNFSETKSFPFGQPRKWPHKSPDLTPCDFFVGVSQITCVSNTSTEFGRLQQQNHCRSAFIAARYGSPSCSGYGKLVLAHASRDYKSFHILRNCTLCAKLVFINLGIWGKWQL